jgi:hypothetical protein
MRNGAGVEVTGPAELRREIGIELRLAAARYDAHSLPV